MKKIILLSLVLFFYSLPIVYAKPVKFGWSEQPGEPVVEYKVHAGTESGVYTEVYSCGLPTPVNGTCECVLDIPPGMRYFAATAWDAEGFGSDYSNEVDHLVTPYPTAPVSFTAETGPEILLLP